MSATKLVIGASGFLGSHVTKLLVADGEDVRVLLRPTSSTRAIEGLDVERRVGDIFDDDALRAAMTGCDIVYYCVVDARPWLIDPTPMYRTNVDGLRNVLEIAAEMNLKRFVFTSSIATVGHPSEGLATEAHENNWLDKGGDYVRSRVEAERLVLRFARERSLPAVAMCVANTYGAHDWLPTPHGQLVAAAVRQRTPVFFKDVAAEVVGVEDAARALILAGSNGRIGERYIVAERFMSAAEINEIACGAVGVPVPRHGVPLPILYVIGTVAGWIARVRRRDSRLTKMSVRLMHIMPRMDHGKAERELGWRPNPAPDAIADAARFFLSRRTTPPTAVRRET